MNNKVGRPKGAPSNNRKDNKRKPKKLKPQGELYLAKFEEICQRGDISIGRAEDILMQEWCIPYVKELEEFPMMLAKGKKQYDTIDDDFATLCITYDLFEKYVNPNWRVKAYEKHRGPLENRSIGRGMRAHKKDVDTGEML